MLDRLCEKLGEAIDAVDIGDVKALKELTATVHELQKIRESALDGEEVSDVGRSGVLIMPAQETMP